MDYRELFDQVHRRPGLYGLDGSFHDFTVFLGGCDAGNDWQLLAGFREMLVARCGFGDNLVWEGLVLHQAFPDGLPGRDRLRADPALNEAAVDTLFRLVDEFLERRSGHSGLSQIFKEYLARPSETGRTQE